jgi:hypothetical protein
VASVESAAGARRRGRRTRSAIEPVEEAIVLSIFRLYSEGLSLDGIAGRLNSEGVLGPRGAAH